MMEARLSGSPAIATVETGPNYGGPSFVNPGGRVFIPVAQVGAPPPAEGTAAAALRGIPSLFDARDNYFRRLAEQRFVDAHYVPLLTWIGKRLTPVLAAYQGDPGDFKCSLDLPSKFHAADMSDEVWQRLKEDMRAKGYAVDWGAAWAPARRAAIPRLELSFLPPSERS